MQEEIVFILVVQINGRLGHAGALSNLLQRSLLVASLGKDCLRHPSNGSFHKGTEHRLLRLAHALLDLDHAFSLPHTVPVILPSVYVKEAMVTSWRWMPRQYCAGSIRDSGLQNFTCSTNSSNRALVCLMGRSNWATRSQRKEYNMRKLDDPRAAGAQQTAQPRSRRRFLTGVVAGGFLGSLLAGGINLYSHAQPGPGWWFRAGHSPGGSWRQGAYDPDMVQARIEFATDWLLSRVEASDEQRQQVKAIVQATVQDLAPMREQNYQKKKTMLQALTQPTIKRAGV